MNQEPILKIHNLSVSLTSAGTLVHALDGLSLTVYPGQTVALVGESGCGKSICAHSIVRLLPDKVKLYQDSEILFEGTDLLKLSEYQMRSIRKTKIGMIFQDPQSALNPVLTIETQIVEALPAHMHPFEKVERIRELLDLVRIPEPERMKTAYPHHLSGGMKQRIMIAIALAREPDLLIADEPTTALDVTTQAQILNLLKEIQKKKKMAILLITHDLGVVAQVADWVAVMYSGYIIEQSKAADFFSNPKHPYSEKLLASLPEKGVRGTNLAVIPGMVPQRTHRSPLCRFRERCHWVTDACHQHAPLLYDLPSGSQVRCLAYDEQQKDLRPKKVAFTHEALPLPYDDSDHVSVLKVVDLKVHFPIKKGILKRTVGYVKAVDGLTFDLFPGKTFALVGESGCGKTTAGKAILKLIPHASGRVVYWGQELLSASERKVRSVRGDLQIIFQDPFSSMDPKMRVYQILEEGMIALKIGSDRKERMERMDNLLEQVGLDKSTKFRYPHEFSGGQRQRIAIARALSVNPKLIICDEPTSALDVSVQAQILNLLERLQLEYEISYLFITHNMGVVRFVADELAVMYLGKIVEVGDSEMIMKTPLHPYTQLLLSSVPSIDSIQAPQTLRGEVPSAANPPQGCHFHPRCPSAMAICTTEYPQEYAIDSKHKVRCFLYAESETSQNLKKIPLRVI